MSLHLELRTQPSVPLEVEGLTPDAVDRSSLNSILKTRVFHGNRHMDLGDFFRLRGDPAADVWHWEGDLSGVHWIGAKLKQGAMHVHGPAGRHVGSEMSGGCLLVEGDVSDWAGAEMAGGLLQVRGNAGHLVGAAYRGSRRGVTGGTILIAGNAGNEVGMTMRRGLIAIGGSCGDLLAINLLAGTVVVLGPVGIRAGAGMHRGTLVLGHAESLELLPTFRRATQCQPLVLQLIFRELQRHQFDVPRAMWNAAFDLYHGDLIEGGRGEIFVRCAA